MLLHNHEAECAVLNFIGLPDGSTPITMDNQGDSYDVVFAPPQLTPVQGSPRNFLQA